MIGFVLVGTNDLDRATQFYDKICAAFGAKRLYQMIAGCTGVMYGTGRSHARCCSALRRKTVTGWQRRYDRAQFGFP